MKKKRLIFIIIMIALLITAISLYQYRRAPNDFSRALKGIPQDATFYLPANFQNQVLISASQQQARAKEFLARYFAPWTQNPFAYSPWAGDKPMQLADIRAKENKYIDSFSSHPGWGENHLHYSSDWFKPTIANMNWATFPNRQQRGITIHSSSLRVLPTTDPSYDNWNNAGEGYPFDYLQESKLPANTPVLILQTTKDGVWDFILFNYDAAWIKAEDVATVDDGFMQVWQTGAYVTPLKDHISIRDKEGLFRFVANIGTIYPVEKNACNSSSRVKGADALAPLGSNCSSISKNFPILIAVADADQHAVIKTANLSSQDMALWPMPATATNIAGVLNKLLGTYYGWGEIKGYRDCSSTTMNYFASLGIWLPRNSSDQTAAGKYIALDHLNNKEKQTMISKQAIPWITLFKLPGHVVLYIGQKNGKMYIFHDFWGVHTRTLFGDSGRAIVGKTAITPIDFGKGYTNVPQTFLDKIQGMVVISEQQ